MNVCYNSHLLDLLALIAALHCLLYYQHQLAKVYKSVHSWHNRMVKYITVYRLKTTPKFHSMGSWFSSTRIHLVLQPLDPCR